jgi:hypothetical protein
VLIRGLILSGMALACAGCAGEAQLGKGMAAPFTTSALAATTPTQATLAPGEMPRKTMSDKILAAIALERVTGLKPDPSRLTSN